MVKLLLALILGIPFIGPNTELLMVSKSCAPCVEAVEIVSQLQDEGYNVVIINIKGTPPERALARLFRVRMTPTLVICELGEKPEKIVGLKTEAEYRGLISQ